MGLKTEKLIDYKYYSYKKIEGKVSRVKVTTFTMHQN